MFSFIGDIGFFIILFIMVGFLLSVSNLLNFLLLCEIIWISIYFICVVYGSWLDSLVYCIWGVLFLCLATSETVIGLSLLLLNGNIDETVKELSVNRDRQNLNGRNFSNFWSSLL